MPNQTYEQSPEYPYGKWQVVLWRVHWPPFGFRFIPRSWGLYAVYRWTLWFPGLEVRRWVGTSETKARLAAQNTEHNEVKA